MSLLITTLIIICAMTFYGYQVMTLLQQAKVKQAKIQNQSAKRICSAAYKVVILSLLLFVICIALSSIEIQTNIEPYVMMVYAIPIGMMMLYIAVISHRFFNQLINHW